MDPNQSQPNENQPQPSAPAQPADWNQASVPTSEPASFTAPAAPVADPAYTQPTPQPQPLTPTAIAQPQPTVTSASKGLSIAALVVGIVASLTTIVGIGILLGLVAVILGIVALVKHRDGKGFAIAGIVLGALAFVFGGILFAIVLAAYGGIQGRAETSSYQTSASTVIKNAEAYNVENGTSDGDVYPTYDQLLSGSEFAQLPSETKAILHKGTKDSVSNDKPLAYHGCSAGAVVYYWDVTQSIAKEYKSAGDPSSC